MSSNIILSIQKLSISTADRRLLQEVSFSVREGECWAITGVSGSGKSTLVYALANYSMHLNEISFNPNTRPIVAYVPHQNRFKNLVHTDTFYYQQRFNSSDNNDAQTIQQVLGSISKDHAKIEEILRLMQLDHLGDASQLQLSNGEHKRLQVARALLQLPDWLFLDNPYIGLDKEGRKKLDEILVQIMESGVQVMTTTNKNPPKFITHVCNLSEGKVEKIYTRAAFEKSKKSLNTKVRKARGMSLAVLPTAREFRDFGVAVKMQKVNVKYQQKSVLEDIDWTVNKGERWSISGPNGSGKSTLLSLITGDNPQAFANDIILFDRQRGSGETIWEIKEKIGYVSPELHHYFGRNFTGFDVVASGLFDTVGLFKKLSVGQTAVVHKCMDIFEISDFQKKIFSALSNGEQRLVLLARAMIKNPPLLILDEPCQGLDEDSTRNYLQMLNEITSHSSRTLLYVSHYEDQTPLCITHTLTLNRGRIKEIKIKHEKKNNSNSRRRDRA